MSVAPPGGRKAAQDAVRRFLALDKTEMARYLTTPVMIAEEAAKRRQLAMMPETMSSYDLFLHRTPVTLDILLPLSEVESRVGCRMKMEVTCQTPYKAVAPYSDFTLKDTWRIDDFRIYVDSELCGLSAEEAQIGQEINKAKVSWLRDEMVAGFPDKLIPSKRYLAGVVPGTGAAKRDDGIPMDIYRAIGRLLVGDGSFKTLVNFALTSKLLKEEVGGFLDRQKIAWRDPGRFGLCSATMTSAQAELIK